MVGLWEIYQNWGEMSIIFWRIRQGRYLSLICHGKCDTPVACPFRRYTLRKHNGNMSEGRAMEKP